MKCPGTALDAVRGAQVVDELTDSVAHVFEDTDHGGNSDERLNNPAQSLREAPW